MNLRATVLRQRITELKHHKSEKHMPSDPLQQEGTERYFAYLKSIKLHIGISVSHSLDHGSNRFFCAIQPT